MACTHLGSRVRCFALVGFLFGLLEFALESAAFQSPPRTPTPPRLKRMRASSLSSPRRSWSAGIMPKGGLLASRGHLLLRMMGGGADGITPSTQSDVAPSAEGCAITGVERGGTCCPSADEKLPFFSPDTKDFPLDYFGESTRGDLLPSEDLAPPSFFTSDELKGVCDQLGLDKWGTPKTWGLPAQPQRAVFCSRTVNMRSIRCIGYDMDYTLIHYKVVEWEGRAYMYAKENLAKVGFPVDDLVFNPELACRGLIIDKKLGNLVKVDRFGQVKRAMHGTRRLSIRETHDVYGRSTVELRDSGRWLFLNTLFSVSEGCLYAQLVEKLDSGKLSLTDENGQTRQGQLSYEQLFNAVSKALFKAHVEGRLKTDVMRDPERYVEFDNELPLTLLDQREAGKKLALITNSDWDYTKVMMQQVFDRFLPAGMTWRDLFDVIIVSSRKPAFFSQTMPLYEIVTEDGMMREKFRMKEGRVYSGGNAGMVEKLFECESDDIMYVGDHIFTDVNIAKSYMRWRTALIVREVEEEVIAMDRGRQTSQELFALVKSKEQSSNVLNHLRTELHRYRSTNQSSLFNADTEKGLYSTMARLIHTMVKYDNTIAPMLYQEGSHFNPYWGYLSRAGFNDKSHFMRQIEKHADVYTSRVSNFLRYTPYMYFRSYTNTIAHNRNLDKYREEVPKWMLENIDSYPQQPDGEDASVVLQSYQSYAPQRIRSACAAGGGAANAEPLNTLSRRASTNDKSLEPRESGVSASQKTLQEAPGSWSRTGIGVPEETVVVHRGPEFETLESSTTVQILMWRRSGSRSGIQALDDVTLADSQRRYQNAVQSAVESATAHSSSCWYTSAVDDDENLGGDDWDFDTAPDAPVQPR